MSDLDIESTISEEAEPATESAPVAPAEAAPAQPMINVAGAPAFASAESGEDLRLTLGEFSGPLDLLLFLIRQEQVDIYEIPIARITDEYLRYLRMMQELDIALAGDFLVMAATLIEIKSRMLLPRDPNAPADLDEDDPRRELIDRLLEHEKFKAAAELLWSRATVERAIYHRGELETDKSNPEVAVGVFDLFKVFQTILARHQEEVLMEIEREEISQAQMIERLRELVLNAVEVNLREFFELCGSRRELVLAFLSVLELVKESVIGLVQRETFGDIFARGKTPEPETATNGDDDEDVPLTEVNAVDNGSDDDEDEDDDDDDQRS
jgi:segregation and condensation protein A